MNYANRVLWAALETTYNTDPSPTSADSIITTGLTINPYQGDSVSVEIDEPTMGASVDINTGPNVEINFGVYLAGSGTAGTPPFWGRLLEACGFEELIDPGVSVIYSPVSTDFKSLCIYFNVDGQRQVALGARGTVSIELGRGQLPKLNFTFTGFYAKPTAATQSLDKAQFVEPLPVTKANTPKLLLGTYAAKAESFTYNQNNNVIYRNVINGCDIFITDRDPSGSFLVEAPILAAKDLFELVESHNGVATSSFELEHGTTSGNIVTLSSNKMQLSSISEQDSDGILMYSMDAKFINDAGDDDFEIKLT